MHRDHERDVDHLLRDTAHRYRVPPEPPLDAMWARIEEAHFGRAGRGRRLGARGWLRAGLGLAAGLALGIGIGRYTARSGGPGGALIPASSPSWMAERAVPRVADTAAAGGPYEVATTQYLGQAAALLIALPAQVRDGRADSRFVAQAADLLTTTRLLLDSPAAADPELRGLLDDLELVLAQIARLRGARATAELDLITGTLEQRDVIPRLRSVAADVSGSDD